MKGAQNAESHFKEDAIALDGRVVACMVIALGGAGIAATGGNFILGQSNTAATPSVLIGNVTTNTLELRNLNAGPAATALRLNTAANRAPMRVNSSVRVVNFNADYLDGRTADAFGLKRL